MTNPFTRGLSEEAMDTLKEGYLSPIIEAIKEHNKKNEKKLSFKIRKKSADIYYNGGRLANLNFKDDECEWTWNANYYYNIKEDKESVKGNAEKLEIDDIGDLDKEISYGNIKVNLRPKGSLNTKGVPRTSDETTRELRTLLKSEEDVKEKFIAKWEYLMPIMEKRNKGGNVGERAFQQNFEYANTKNKDFFIIDTEYALGGKAIGKNANFDMLALEKLEDDLYQLVIIENKVGKSSSASKEKGSGIKNHLDDMYKLVTGKDDLYVKFQENALKIANQLKELGLLEFEIGEIVLKKNMNKVKVVFPMYKCNDKNKIKEELEKVSEDIKNTLDIYFLFLEGDNFEYKKDGLESAETIIK